MPLDIATLQNSIKAAFKKAKDVPPPNDPSQADQAQEDILTQLSRDLANAMNVFVRSAEVANVVVEVKNSVDAVIGTGTQTAPVKLQ
jgi:hypothetical protein